jgi:ParB family chromosome partitioning protein
VCRALAALADPRGINRLRSLLFDPDAAVRDAAFTGLAKLQASEPLQSAEAGLNAAFEDVRRRGLQELLTLIRAAPQNAESGPALEMLGRALNDSFPGVRGEAFKAVLNLQAAGGGVRTLRFALQSVHADVRREVLTEVMAQVNEQWAWNLLLEFYNDADARLREEAFAFAVRKTKELPPLETALQAQYPDVRKLAVEALIKKHTNASQALLVKALADANKGVRQLALGALVGEDAQGPLTEALSSPHPDIRARAACALARHGAGSALAPLLALATAPEPQEKERRPDWMALVEQALEGLADLGEPAAIPSLIPLLRSEHASIRKLAARALAWSCLPNHPEPLRQALQHSDPQVKYNAALGLAYIGDPLVSSLVFSEPAGQVLSKDEQLVGAYMLGQAGEDQLAVFLDEENEALRTRALLIFLLLEAQAPQGAPTRCLACLSSRAARVRLTAARALERYSDLAAFRAFVVQLFNDRGDEPAWKVGAADIEALGQLLAYGSLPARARSAHLLRHLAGEQAAWKQAWGLHADRYAAEIDALKKAAKKREAPSPQYTPAQLQELAFGAYVGLVREQGGASARGRGTEAQVIRVRQTALSRILELAKEDATYNASARPVLVQALGDPNKDVRMQAFDQLAALGVDSDTLGAAALGAGHTDVGVRGLEALAGGGTSAEGQAVLEEAMRTRTDDLAVEAAKLLIARRDVVSVAGLALAAAHDPLRMQAVQWLTAEYDRSEAAKEALRQALSSRHRKVMAHAALELATKKDAAAFDALVKLLQTSGEQGPQRRVIAALQRLGDPRAVAALLDRLENDPEGTALVDELFTAAAEFRRPDSAVVVAAPGTRLSTGEVPSAAGRLLVMCEKEKWGAKALRAAFVVSGFDQHVEDPEDENQDRRWEEKQHPRHPAILARVLQRALDLKMTSVLPGFLPSARWSRGKEVDPVLALLAFHADDRIRHDSVEAIGWRLRKRHGPHDTLVKLLSHREPVTQLIAAEGLAKAGREQGLSVLMSAVELQSDLNLRQRAVTALGELGDARALDLLLKIVNEEGHVLRSEAAEALGHLGHTQKSEEILRLLQQFARGDYPLNESALKGLRWLDHPEGWQLIRRQATDVSSVSQEVAVEQLGYHDDPATRDLLLRLLAETEDEMVFDAAMDSARRLWGKESLEPEYAAVQNRSVFEAEME